MKKKEKKEKLRTTWKIFTLAAGRSKETACKSVALGKNAIDHSMFVDDGHTTTGITAINVIVLATLESKLAQYTFITKRVQQQPQQVYRMCIATYPSLIRNN